MQEQAIAKLRSEIEASNNPAVKAIGQFLLQHIEQNPDMVAHVLEEGKTITKSLDAMREVARKKAVGSVAVLTDEEGFAIVLDYYTKAATKASKAETAKPKPETTEPEAEASKSTDKPKRQRKKKAPEQGLALELEPEPDEPTADEEAADDEDFDFDALLE